MYDAVLAKLSAAAWQAVLLVALSRTGALGLAEPSALDEAVAHGVLAAPQGYRFQHPLLRAAVLRLADPAQQRDTHRALAATLTPGAPGHAHHLAAVATGPDDLARTRGLVGQVLTSTSAPAQGRALFTLGMVEQYAGSNPRAADHLAAACATLTGASLVDALTELAMVRFRARGPGGVR